MKKFLKIIIVLAVLIFLGIGMQILIGPEREGSEDQLPSTWSITPSEPQNTIMPEQSRPLKDFQIPGGDWNLLPAGYQEASLSAE